MSSVIEAAKKAKAASAQLARLTTADKNRALAEIARALESNAEAILAANCKDLEAAKLLVEAGEMNDALYRRLKLDDGKLRDIIAGVEQVAALEDPVGKVTYGMELDEGLRLYRVNCPIG